MRSKLFRVGALLMAVVMLFSLAACGKKPPEDLSSEGVPTTTAPTTAATTDASTSFVNPLTGGGAKTANNRPVAVMVGNYGYSGDIQQKNIDKADFYLEAETEGGIGRIMAVFGSIDNLPKEFGPVRSARTHFIKMAKALDAIYCHVGASDKGYDLIDSIGITSLSSIVKQSSQLKAANGATEHTKILDYDKIMKTIDSRSISKVTTTAAPFTFGEKAGDGAGSKVQVNVSGSWKVSFTYDANTGLYTKHRSSLSSAVHKSIDGAPIQVNNVIVMYDKKYQEDNSHISFTLESGSGIVISGGKSRQIRWSRNNGQLSFTETDGTALTVAKGKTYVVLTDNGQAAKTILE